MTTNESRSLAYEIASIRARLTAACMLVADWTEVGRPAEEIASMVEKAGRLAAELVELEA